MSKSLLSRSCAAALIAILIAVPVANADFEISVASGSIDPGGTLQLEIGIASDAPPQNLSDFELILELVPLTATGTSSLQFVDPQSEDFLADADYIFAGSSEASADPLVASYRIDSATQITFIDISSDAIGDFLNVPVSSGHLLATLDLVHELNGTAAAATAGDAYAVRVGLLSGFFQANGSEIDFFSTNGVVSVNAVAIPEPGVASVLLLGCCGLVMRRRRSSRVGNRVGNPRTH